jgi:acylaminoacyl-peptidase
MENIALKDFLDYRFVSELKLSPDQKHAAFVVGKCNLKENKYDTCIHILDCRRNEVRQLTFAGDSKTFIWLDNESLLFPALRGAGDKKKAENGEKLTVYQRIGLYGGEAQEFFQIPFSVSSIAKMDEDHFALVCKYDPGDPDYTAMSDAEKARAYEQIKENKDYEILDEIPFWVNGAGFTSKRRNRLYLYTRSENHLTPITDEYSNVLCSKVTAEGIWFSANRYTDKMQPTSGVYRYMPGRPLETLVPDGRLLINYVDLLQGEVIFAGGQSGSGKFPNLYRLQGGEALLLKELDESMGSGIGSDCRYGAGTQIKAFGDAVYYTTVSHTDAPLKKITVKGDIAALTGPGGSVDGFDVGENGILFYGMLGDRLQEVYALEDNGPRQLTGFNDWVLLQRAVCAPRRLEAQSGDTLIEGFVLPPADFDPGKTYPAILEIHGGPKAAFGSVFFHEMQLFAGAGYFVFFCNPRGGDGRGSAFADIRGKYGTVDFEDLMCFTDAVLGRYPQIDPSRLGVTGGSYGGYMTNWIIGHTDRFKAAVSLRSIANWFSKFATTDIGYYHNAAEQASTPWDHPEKMWWHSPMKYADRVKTPTLFIHSDEDYRCWYGEGLQMFTALKYFGVESRLCLIRGENHELSRSGKPKHRIKRLEEMSAWFDKHLK